MLRTFLTATVIFTAMAAGAAASAPPPPSLKPDKPYASRVVSTQDAATLSAALRAAEEGRWSRAEQLQNSARSDIVRDLIAWRRASAGPPGMRFEEIAEVMARLKNWPDQRQMQVRAEDIISLSRLSHAERISWLQANGPISGPGRVALARSLRATGQQKDALKTIRAAWHGNTLERDLTRDVIRVFGDDLTQEDHRKRADFLLWTGQRSAASRMKTYLTADWRALVDARIALQARRRGVDGAVAAVPSHLESHPGLMHDRARWRRQRGMQDTATPLLVGIDGADVPAAGRGRLWDERSLAARRSLRDEDFVTAYSLAAPHGLSQGRDFAEAEWMAGWISLRMRNDADRALSHFTDLSGGVSTPISAARADYWAGRALEAMGDGAAADEAYGRAASYNYTYYGQLAAERIGETAIALSEPAAPTEAERTAFENRPQVKALRLLAEAGETRLFRKFAYHLDDQLETAAEYQLLKDLAHEYHQYDISVRGAKAGLARGIVAPDAAYPIVDYPLLREPRVERSLMLALSRQESEMNPRAISHANARGLMQFIPATAARETRMRGLPYRTSWLTDDPGYNMTLGGAHLDTLLGQFNGSYIMTAAAYNAGASRPRRWVDDYGDPRKGEIDPVDWVEFIPFSETRNYVQRVLENTQVYRHRLSGEEEDIQLYEDLNRGRMD